MSIASLNAEALMISDQLAEYEVARTIIDQQREALAMQSADAYSKFSIEQQFDSQDADAEVDEDAFNSKAWEKLYKEYQIVEAKIQAQDKPLEMERARLDTKIEMLEASKESVDKRLQSNIEKDFKGIQ